MAWRETLKANLIAEEGIRYKPYKDSLGIETIGVGRNLDEVGLRPVEVDFMLENDMNEAEQGVRSLVDDFESLSDTRKAVVTDLCFNMGLTRFRMFVKFLGYTKQQDWESGAQELEKSLWYRQVEGRGPKLVNLWRQG